jgi:hypothetical protein
MCFNNILLSKPGLRKCSFTFLFSDQNLLCISAMHAASPPPSHNSWFDLLNTIWWTLKIMAIFIVKLHLLLPLKSKYSSQQFVLKHPLRFTIWSLALLRYAKFHTIKKQDWKDVLFEYTGYLQLPFMPHHLRPCCNNVICGGGGSLLRLTSFLHPRYPRSFLWLRSVLN